MGREVRMVPPDYEHPRDKRGWLIPLHDGLTMDIKEWEFKKEKWDKGLRLDFSVWPEKTIYIPKDPNREDLKCTWEEWYGEKPSQEDYMLDFPNELRTHYMMFETCSEGTPISPAFATKEELARWPTDNNASASGKDTASYEAWLAMINEGRCFTGALTEEGLITGPEFCLQEKEKEEDRK